MQPHKAEGHHTLSSAPISMLIKEGDEKGSSSGHGFPPGCFILRSVTSAGRLLDVASDSVEDGAEVILWPGKDNSLVESKFFF
jgi:hypothetical protein